MKGIHGALRLFEYVKVFGGKWDCEIVGRGSI